MSRRRPNPRDYQALLIAAAADALGGDDAAEFAAHIWRTHFRAMAAN